MDGARVSKPLVLLALEKEARWHVTKNQNRSFRILRPNNQSARAFFYNDLFQSCVAPTPCNPPSSLQSYTVFFCEAFLYHLSF